MASIEEDEMSVRKSISRFCPVQILVSIPGPYLRAYAFWIIGLLLTGSPLAAQAQTPQKAYHLLRLAPAGWILEMRFDSEELDQAMNQAGLPVAGMSHLELRQTTIDYVLSGLKVVSREGFPAEPEVLRYESQSGSTNLIFRFRNWRPQSAPLHIVILAGSENKGHTNVLEIEDGRKVVLDATNHYSVDFAVKPDGESSVTTPGGFLNSNKHLFWAMLPLLGLGLAFFVLSRKPGCANESDLECEAHPG
tara:strand:+ start:9280 stop:10026 length:747 start_codon:yes stop_codon:yes gene_type:complete